MNNSFWIIFLLFNCLLDIISIVCLILYYNNLSNNIYCQINYLIGLLQTFVIMLIILLEFKILYIIKDRKLNYLIYFLILWIFTTIFFASYITLKNKYCYLNEINSLIINIEIIIHITILLVMFIMIYNLHKSELSINRNTTLESYPLLLSLVLSTNILSLNGITFKVLFTIIIIHLMLDLLILVIYIKSVYQKPLNTYHYEGFNNY